MSKMKCPNCGIRLPNKTIKVKELGIEVETQLHDLGKSFSEIIIPKGWRLLTVDEITFLYNNFMEYFNMDDTHEHIEHPIKRNRERGYVARFGVDSDGAYLSYGRNPDLRGASLGVRFCRDLKVKK